MKYLFIKVFKWYWLIYLFIIIVKVNVLVDIILYFVCYVYVLVKCFYVIISMVEKIFLIVGFCVKIVIVGILVFVRIL